ncbi:MAG: hypothetical protein II653_04370 [Lachnospiraceae bacterium]|nr:hypothetical protein [Lachnospiraceae bacterium]
MDKELMEMICNHVKTRMHKNLVNKLATLQSKRKANGEPYKTDWLLNLLADLHSVNFQHLMEKFIQGTHISTKTEPLTIHQLIGFTIPKEVASHNKCDMLNKWSSAFLTALNDLHILRYSQTKIENMYDVPSYKSELDGWYLDLSLYTHQSVEDKSKILSKPNLKPKKTLKTLGSIWSKDGDELDHNSIIIGLLNKMALTVNSDVLKDINYEFTVSEPKDSKWDPCAYPNKEDWINARITQHEQYVGKIPEQLKELEGKTIYNTHAADNRLRLYINNDIGNYIGIKYLRGVYQFEQGCYVNPNEF